MSAAPVLTILKNGETIRTCPIEGKEGVMLGRADGCAVRLEDRAISRQHAVFRVVDGGVQVEKRSEFAPLMVNGAECTRALIKEADIIAIGPYLMRVSVPKPAPQPAPAQPPAAPTSDDLSAGPPGQGQEPAEAPGLQQPDGEDSPGLEPLEEPGEAGGGIEMPVLEDASANGALAAGMEALDGMPAIELGGPGGVPNSHDPLDGGEIPLAGLGSGAAGDGATRVEMAEDDARTKLAPAAKLSVQLLFDPGAANVTDFELTRDEVSIGRGKDCDIVLNDKKASRKNAVIRRSGLSFTIKDLDSANGTFVNGARVTEQELASDDVVRIGGVEFKFKATSADYPARAADFMPVPEEPSMSDPGLPLDAAEAMALHDSSQLPMLGSEPAGGAALDLAGAMAAAAGPLPGAGAAAAAGIPGITGVVGLGPGDTKNMSIFEKLRNFKSLPKKDRYILIAIVGGLIYFGMDMFEEEPAPVKKRPKPAAAAPAAPGVVTFESLPPEKQRFIEAQRNLAFEHFKNREYDKALYELEKIFAIIPEYKDARDIERFAREAKRKLEAFEEEKRKKEAEAQLKAKVQGLLDECKERMDKKQYEQARELFAEISVLDPDNQQVSLWRKEIEEYEEKRRLDESAKQVQSQINAHAWEVYGEGMALKKAGKFHSAIEVFGKVVDIGSSDAKVNALSLKQVKGCRAAIRDRREPVLAEARQAEKDGDFPKAFGSFKRATRIDPPHPEGYAGMARIRGILHDRAKAIYTEAVLAESYSDFSTAKRKFQECLEVAPADDIYHDRATRKLARYFRGGVKDEGMQ